MYLFYFAGAAVLTFLGIKDMNKKKVSTPETVTPKIETPIVTPVSIPIGKKDDGATV